MTSSQQKVNEINNGTLKVSTTAAEFFCAAGLFIRRGMRATSLLSIRGVEHPLGPHLCNGPRIVKSSPLASRPFCRVVLMSGVGALAALQGLRSKLRLSSNLCKQPPVHLAKPRRQVLRDHSRAGGCGSFAMDPDRGRGSLEGRHSLGEEAGD